MKGPAAPTPPDPFQTAGAQTAQNIGTAVANNAMGMVDQVTPWGSMTYTSTGGGPVGGTAPTRVQTGTRTETRQVWNASKGQFDRQTVQVPVYQTQPGTPATGGQGGTVWTDPNTGKVYNLPRYTQTVTLSPDEQRKLELGNATDIRLGEIGLAQTGRIGDLLGTPIDLSNEATEARLMELGTARLAPALERRREALRTSLSQQGIKEGSEAFDRAMARAMEGENDAYNQLLLTGRGQAVQEALTERNQPINEITALLSGSQVSMPQFGATPTAPVANVDTAGLIANDYNQRLGIWNNDQQRRQAMMGGLFGLGARAISGGVF